jgi:pimeloyl-ACP methyl ester carboxylesterase
MPQPQIPGNGCPCVCCGAGPAKITVENIKKHGNKNTKWLQKADGRVIEYYVYGSEEPDAKVFLQINGSMGSAKFFSEMPSMISELKAKNVKGIAVNVAGHGFTSGDPLRIMGDWAKSDVEPVLKVEGVPDDAPLIIEGSSFGTAHAQSAMHYFQDRVTHVHLHVPAMAAEISKEYDLKPIKEGGSCKGSYATTCFLMPGYCCSPLLFCCCSTCVPMSLGEVDGLKKLKGYDEIGFDLVDIMKRHNMKHSFSNGLHGLVYNCFLGQLYKNWGFHPFNDIKVENVEKMKIMISYGEKDPSSPESHGEKLAQYYTEKCNLDGKMFKNVEPSEVIGNAKGGKCLVNHGPGGHEAHFIPFCKGDLLRKLLEL